MKKIEGIKFSTIILISLSLFIGIIIGYIINLNKNEGDISVIGSLQPLNLFVDEPADKITSYYFYNLTIDSDNKLQKIEYSNKKNPKLPDGIKYIGHDKDDNGNNYMIIEVPAGFLFKIENVKANLNKLNEMGKAQYERAKNSKNNGDK